jgi:hypothetical protein
VKDAVRKVDPKSGDRRAANRGAANQDGAVPAEMPAPLVAARVEEPNDSSGLGINTGEIRPFLGVVEIAGEGEVPGPCLAAMALGDDVVDLKSQWIVILMHLAVFAPTAGALPNQVLKGAIHGRLTGGDRLSRHRF